MNPIAGLGNKLAESFPEHDGSSFLKAYLGGASRVS